MSSLLLGQTLFFSQLFGCYSSCSLGLGCDSLPGLMGRLGIPLHDVQSNIYKWEKEIFFVCVYVCVCLQL